METLAGPIFDDAPRIVIWELTRACALACRHCRAEAIPRHDPNELTVDEARELVDAVAQCGRPLFVLSGGDPLMREDLYEIVEYAVSVGLRVAVSPSATGRLTRHALERLAAAGCSRISLSLDAPDAKSHDAFRGVTGSFERTLAGLRNAREQGIEVQINTTISRFNHKRIAEFAEFLKPLDIALWSLFFLVPVGRGTRAEALDAVETEAAFNAIYEATKYLEVPVKTTEAPHFRRFVAERDPHRAPMKGGIGDGRGFVFISHVGEVHPSGFLPYVVGNVRESRLIDLYRNDPVMQSLRRPDGFGGKCGSCEYRYLCGGSRARAYASSGDLLGEDPSCIYHAPTITLDAIRA